MLFASLINHRAAPGCAMDTPATWKFDFVRREEREGQRERGRERERERERGREGKSKTD